MQMSCRGRGFKSLCVLAASRHAKITETVLTLNVKMESVREEVTTCRKQQDVSELLVDEFMLLMWS